MHFSLCGYHNKYSFENFGDNDIEYVENFVQTKLLQMLTGFCNKFKITMNEDVMKHFFGKYALQPHNFCFEDTEKELIQTLSEILDVPDGIELNSIEIDEISENWKSFKGWYFCDNSENESNVLRAPKEAVNLMTKLHSVAENNALRPKNGFRYTNAIKRFCVHNRLLAGQLSYKTIQANYFGVFPSLSATNKYIHRPDHGLIEGEIRSQELLVYLKGRNQPLWVALSEDGTKIENRIQYDPRTNQLIGFVLPTNQETGMPQPFVFKALSAEKIVEHFQAPIANNLNTIMAQPLGGAPSFCLMLFGSDNKYTGLDVSKRWKNIINERKGIGIGVVSFSSDSDSKYNKGMRINSKLGCYSPLLLSNNLFKSGLTIEDTHYVQDTPHILTKLRNRLLTTINSPAKLQFGRRFIKMTHLKYLVDNFGKDQHLLTSITLNSIDHQNVDSALRICDRRVINMLKLHVKDSEATVLFLETMLNSYEAFMSEILAPLERIEKMWYVLFIVRIWRHFVINHSKLTIGENFLTANCYSCLEQNAHSIILIILFLKKKIIYRSYSFHIYLAVSHVKIFIDKFDHFVQRSPWLPLAV